MPEVLIQLPHLYKPRSYQQEVFEAYNRGIKHFILVWHRRSGKDTTFLNFCILRMMERVGQYWHVLPTYTQAESIIWRGIGSRFNRDQDYGEDDQDWSDPEVIKDKSYAHGIAMLDYFPEQLVAKKDNSALEVTLVNGSIYKLVGSDKIDSVVGTNPVGLIFSEYSLQIPAAYELLAPILVENGGWAAFIFTPRGRNHAWNLWDKTKDNPRWFRSYKTITDTRRDAEGEDGSVVVLPSDLDEERSRGADEDYIQQEYYCSFSGYRSGSYYGREMVKAETEGRICNVPWEPRLPVFTIWDLGVADSTAIWFCQRAGLEVRWIDYYEASGEGLPHFLAVLRARNYVYSNHYAPHDIEVRELSSGKTRRELAFSLGINFLIVPNIPIQDGIDNVRNVLPRSWFDRTKCDYGLRCLVNYHKEFNEKMGEYKWYPVHDKWSHGADAFRYACLVVDRETDSYVRPLEVVHEFDIWDNPV